LKRIARKPDASVASVLTWIKRHGSEANRRGMARYGITSANVSGVSVGDLRLLAKQIGRNHALALDLWKTGSYEARMLTAFIDEPDRVTPSQMDRWCRDFDSWAVCDALCFHLFDRTPHAWEKIRQWSDRPEEFVRRAAFALLASLALHHKTASDASFLSSLKLIERAASDDRNFVKKAVSWALRGIGKRNPALNIAALKLAKRLTASSHPAARWIGRDSFRDLNTPATHKRIERQRRSAKKK
jgi:3-methyladenine DNA glycosylase AlkD